jgi:hypothetical protein
MGSYFNTYKFGHLHIYHFICKVLFVKYAEPRHGVSGAQFESP